MKLLLRILLLWLIPLTAVAHQDPDIRDLKKGKAENDTSHVYALPFSKGSAYLLVQAYHSGMSHKGEVALDFKMKSGTPICAARGGVVRSFREDSDKGGLKSEMLSEGNYIIIDHGDGTAAHYWHLQKNGVLVEVGDTVTTGQKIGLSGNTGYSAFPHLHFEVIDALRGQIPTRFHTRKGIRYLRPGKWHRAI